jgi:hypothetical protein
MSLPAQSDQETEVERQYRLNQEALSAAKARDWPKLRRVINDGARDLESVLVHGVLAECTVSLSCAYKSGNIDRAICLALLYGKTKSFDYLEAFGALPERLYVEPALEYAIRKDNASGFTRLFATKEARRMVIVRAATRYSRLQYLQYIVPLNHDECDEGLRTAASVGALDSASLMWLYGAKDNNGALVCAARNGRENMLMPIRARADKPLDYHAAAMAAAKAGHTHLVTILESFGRVVLEDVVVEAILALGAIAGDWLPIVLSGSTRIKEAALRANHGAALMLLGGAGQLDGAADWVNREIALVQERRLRLPPPYQEGHADLSRYLAYRAADGDLCMEILRLERTLTTLAAVSENARKPMPA